MFSRLLSLLFASAALAAAPLAAQTASTGGDQDATVLRITSNPSDAQVSVDRAVRGNTPLVLTDLAPGKHLVSVVARDHREAFQSVTVERGETRNYEFDLEPLTAIVLVSTTPVGCSVALDGAYRGAAPLLLSDIALGKHRLSVTRPGYQEKVVELDVANATPQRLEVQLLTDSATLRVSSQPAGAEVLLNGVPRGNTPTVIERIPEGDNEVMVRMAGYASFSQALRLASGDDESLNLTLTPLPGSMQVISMPAGARVYVANQFRGETPLTLEELVPGDYRVRVELAAHDVMARDVSIARDSKVVEEFRLVPNCGELRVVTSPAGVTVLVDGKPSGTTLANPDATDQVSNPLVVPLVGVGQRQVVFSRQGFFEEQRTVEIERDKTTTVDVTLKRRFIPDYEVRTDSNVYRGVLINITPDFVRIETEIGVIRTFPIKDIRGRRPLREDEREAAAEQKH